MRTRPSSCGGISSRRWSFTRLSELVYVAAFQPEVVKSGELQNKTPLPAIWCSCGEDFVQVTAALPETLLPTSPTPCTFHGDPRSNCGRDL